MPRGTDCSFPVGVSAPWTLGHPPPGIPAVKGLPGGKADTVELRVMDGEHPVRVLAGRRADAGTIRLSDRDITGLMLCGEHYGAPYDLPAPRGAVLYRPRSGQRW